MSTINSVGNGLTSQTGTGLFVGATSPTLVGPVLGAASATSINFGGSSLSTYINAGSFTPTFSFATPGNLSVSYGLQIGTYYQIGGIVFFSYTLRFTPTFTTSSGAAIFGGLPVSASASNNWIFPVLEVINVTYPVSTTQLVALCTSGTTFQINGQGSATAAVALSTTQFTTGVQYQIDVSGCYGS